LNNVPLVGNILLFLLILGKFFNNLLLWIKWYLFMLPMDSNNPPMILMMVVALVCAIVPAAGAVLPPSAFAQQEKTSLGEEETLADSIVSNVLNGGDDDDGKQIGEAYQGNNQGATVSATISRNQEQNGNEDIVGGIANDTTHITAEQHAGNVSVPLTLSIDTTTAEEETSTPPPPPRDDAQE
jgi:hypothetical protein